MYNFKKIASLAALIMFVAIALVGCQKKDRPALGDFPKDSNPPGGPLTFFAAFDGSSTNPLMNAVDSVRATFPTDNPLNSGEGVSGKGIIGVSKKFIKYPAFNEWSSSASSFTVAVWVKKNGSTKNNGGGDGPEHIFSLRAKKPDNEFHWSNSVMLFFLEGTNANCQVKVMCVTPSNPSTPNSKPADRWFEWVGAQAISGLLDNNWHHIAIVYNASTSTMKLFIDGKENPNVKEWPGRGSINLYSSEIAEYRVGRGPRNDNEGDGENGWLQSSFKGNMDQLRFYTTAITAAEVAALYNGKK